MGVEWDPLVYAENPSNYLPVTPIPGSPYLGTSKILGTWALVSAEGMGVPKDVVNSGLVFIYSILSPEERDHTYIFKGFEMSAGWKSDMKFLSISAEKHRTIESKNNFYPQGDSKYRYEYSNSKELEFSAGVNIGGGIPGASIDIPWLLEFGLFAELHGSVGISIPLQGYEIVDPVINSTEYAITSTIVSDNPVDLNGNGLYDGLQLVMNISTNKAGTYYITPSLWVNNSLEAAKGSNVHLSKGSNIITLQIPGQYIYYTNHTGPFDVGLIIQDENGSLVYSNFTLGKTQPYDYRQFEHIEPKFNLSYAPIDVDHDGKYDEVQVNLTEANNITRLTLSPMLTAPGWVIYMNATNLTNTTTYTMYIDGMHVRKLMGNLTLVIYVSNMTNGVYLGAYHWSIQEDPSKFESNYPTIENVTPITFNYQPATRVTVNVPEKSSNITVTILYSVGNSSYTASAYFANIPRGLHNLTVLLDSSPFTLYNTNKAIILSATLSDNGLTVDSLKIDKNASFFILPKAKIWNITTIVNPTLQVINTTVDVLSYQPTNATISVLLSSGNLTLSEFAYPELKKNNIVEIPVVFNLSSVLKNISVNGKLTVLVYGSDGQLLALREKEISFRSMIGTLEITSDPAGATVILDGRKIGCTPIYNYPITPGMHNVTIVKDGYTKETFTIDVPTGGNITRHVVLHKVNTGNSTTEVTTSHGASKQHKLPINLPELSQLLKNQEIAALLLLLGFIILIRILRRK